MAKEMPTRNKKVAKLWQNGRVCLLSSSISFIFCMVVILEGGRRLPHLSLCNFNERQESCAYGPVGHQDKRIESSAGLALALSSTGIESSCFR